MKLYDPLGEQDQVALPRPERRRELRRRVVRPRPGPALREHHGRGRPLPSGEASRGRGPPLRASRRRSTSSSPTRTAIPASARPGARSTRWTSARGDIRWRATLGEFDELKARGVPKTGAPNIGGSIVTDGGLVFIAATSDRKFRAFDRDTGDELWTAPLPGERLRHARDLPRQEVGPAVRGDRGRGREQVRQGVHRQDRGLRPARRRRRQRSETSRGRARSSPRRRFTQEVATRPAGGGLPKSVAPQPVAFSHRVHIEKSRPRLRLLPRGGREGRRGHPSARSTSA